MAMDAEALDAWIAAARHLLFWLDMHMRMYCSHVQRTRPFPSVRPPSKGRRADPRIP